MSNINFLIIDSDNQRVDRLAHVICHWNSRSLVYHYDLIRMQFNLKNFEDNLWQKVESEMALDINASFRHGRDEFDYNLLKSENSDILKICFGAYWGKDTNEMEEEYSIYKQIANGNELQAQDLDELSLFIADKSIYPNMFLPESFNPSDEDTLKSFAKKD